MHHLHSVQRGEQNSRIQSSIEPPVRIVGEQYLRNERGRGYIFELEMDELKGFGDRPGWTEQVDLIRLVVDDEEEMPLARRTALPPELTAGAAVELHAPHTTSGTENIFSRITRHKRASVVVSSYNNPVGKGLCRS